MLAKTTISRCCTVAPCSRDTRPPAAAVTVASPSTAPSITFWSLRAQKREKTS